MQIASPLPSLPNRMPPPGLLSQNRRVSPLMLADRLISLAEDADRAGHPQAATTLIGLAYTVLDERPVQ